VTKIKICGLFRPEDIAFVNEARPDWCGFIVNFPKSHRSLTPDQVRGLRAGLDRAVTPVGVFVNQPPETVAGLLLDGTISVAQLHGQEAEDYLAALRARAPGYQIWKAFRVRSPRDVAAAEGSSADLVVLDSGQGTGRTFDWSLARQVRRPFLLAGGLDPDNIPQAIRTVGPFGLDLSSGVETDRRKDREKILSAVQATREEKQGGFRP
jgi:phosphoribosylanthranilate isomerase